MKDPAGNSFLFLGPELGEKLDALNELRSALPAGTEETSFYAGETPLQEIVSILRNGSLFSERRLFLIKNADLVKKKDEAELLASSVKNLDSGAVLVLVSDETRLDKRIEDVVPKENKRIFWELFENKKSEWVANFFRRSLCRIDEGGIRAILEMIENNTDALGRECSRLILFLGKDKTITAEDVEHCLAHTREESAFTLFAAIARGNFLLSLEIFRSLAASKQSAPAITAVLAWCFRKLRDYHALGGNTSDFELKKIGITTSRARSDYAEASKRWPRGADSALALIGEYEYLLRSSGTAWEEILMDKLIFRLCLPS
ncbi:MAG: DNA polymerase III subunit delta [Spirochaetaceae bacterium]|jgi:DNA polymerase-3 subunit delta|nr:DNA polymerase III subunit delta [Spirochaetaceae bacterium]